MEGLPLVQHVELGSNLQGFVGAGHEEGGGMFSPADGGILSTKGKRERHSLNGIGR